MIRKNLTLILGISVLLSCGQNDKQSDYENQIGQMRQEIHSKNELVAVLENQKEELSSRNSFLEEENNLLLEQINELDSQLNTSKKPRPIDLAGLYEIKIERNNGTASTPVRIGRGLQIYRVGEGYRFQNVNLSRNADRYYQSHDVATFVPDQASDYYVFTWEVSGAEGETLTSLVTFEVKFDMKSLVGIQYYEGLRNSAERVEIIKIDEDPFNIPE